jgi:hypothetical protein
MDNVSPIEAADRAKHRPHPQQCLKRVARI